MCVAAASVAEATTYPLDLCKTRWPKLSSLFSVLVLIAPVLTPNSLRLQIQGETTCGLGSNTKYRGMLRTMLGIAREEVSSAH